MSELNVINCTILCKCNRNYDFLILWNCDLLKILLNYISNYTRAYNLFGVNRYEVTVVICSVTCANKHKH